MESGKLSFIPKGADLKTDYKPVYKQAGLGFILKASAFLFILSLAGYGTAYLNKSAITGEIEELSGSLERAKGAFDPGLITEMERLMSTVSLAKDFLAKHPYASNIFDTLEDLTHKKVRFSSFAFQRSSAKSAVSGITQEINVGTPVSLDGEAESYLVLAEQAEIFENSSDVVSFAFENFSLSESGYVSFGLNIVFEPHILLEEP